MVCSISYAQSIVIAQLDSFTLIINSGASKGDSQNPVEPVNVTIPTGATVSWLNNDSVYHQIVSGTPDKGPTNIFYGDFFGPNESYNVTFDTAGIFNYYDPIWTDIKGQVVAIPENDTSLNTNNLNNESIQPLDNPAPVQNESKTSTDTGNTIQTQPETGIDGENSVTQMPAQQQQQRPQVKQYFERPIQEQVQQQFEQPQQPFQQVQEQFQIPQHEDLDSFKATGTIHSYILTPTSPWNATGDWALIVENGEVKNFITSMAWFNGTSSHTHDFLNFDSSGDIELPADNILTIEGEMDVTSNGVVTWNEVESSIIIGGGDDSRTITINVDDEETDHHFAGRPVDGTLKSLTPCSDSPGPNMEILPNCN
jgi:hypothetical protein